MRLIFALISIMTLCVVERGWSRVPEKPTAGDSHYLDIPVETLFSYLDDPENRVSTLFKVPAPIRNMVGFWFLIYVKYSVYQTVIYDRDNPHIVYDVADNREFFDRGLSAVATEIRSKQKLRKILQVYRSALTALINNPRKKFPAGSAGEKIIRLWGNKTRTSAQWKTIYDAVRTQLGQRDRIMQGIAASDRFMPAMEGIFRKFSLPAELTRIPIVESSFNIRAVSKAAAVGVWQFLEKSAKEYLIVDSENGIDERASPIKSAYAAARMFKRNYKILDDYGLAIIAYNHGIRNLIKIRKKYKGVNISKLLTINKPGETPLGYASRNYYAEFLALLHAERYRKELYDMPAKSYSEAISIVRLKKPTSIFEVASIYNVSLYELRLFNPDIFNPKNKLPVGTRVVIPKKLEESLVATPPPANTGEDNERGIASVDEFIEYIR